VDLFNVLFLLARGRLPGHGGAGGGGATVWPQVRPDDPVALYNQAQPGGRGDLAALAPWRASGR
jgi:hypothetical protein